MFHYFFVYPANSFVCIYILRVEQVKSDDCRMHEIQPPIASQKDATTALENTQKNAI